MRDTPQIPRGNEPERGVRVGNRVEPLVATEPLPGWRNPPWFLGGVTQMSFVETTTKSENVLGKWCGKLRRRKKREPPPLPSLLFTALPRPWRLSFRHHFGGQRISLRGLGGISRANSARPWGRRTDPERRPTRGATDDAGTRGFAPPPRDGKRRKRERNYINIVIDTTHFRYRNSEGILSFSIVVAVAFCVSSLRIRPS